MSQVFDLRSSHSGSSNEFATSIDSQPFGESGSENSYRTSGSGSNVDEQTKPLETTESMSYEPYETETTPFGRHRKHGLPYRDAFSLPPDRTDCPEFEFTRVQTSKGSTNFSHVAVRSSRARSLSRRSASPSPSSVSSYSSYHPGFLEQRSLEPSLSLPHSSIPQSEQDLLFSSLENPPTLRKLIEHSNLRNARDRLFMKGEDAGDIPLPLEVRTQRRGSPNYSESTIDHHSSPRSHHSSYSHHFSPFQSISSISEPSEGAQAATPEDYNHPTEAMQELSNRMDHFSCLNPSHASMREEEARLRSFNNSEFRRHTSLGATNQQLAEAGFFYTGPRDRTACWFCNGGLENFEANDIPWEEHAKHYPQCEYLKQQKGPAWIDNISRQHPNIVRPPFPNRVLRKVVFSPIPSPYPDPVPPVTTQAPSTSSHTQPRSRIEDPQQMLEQREQLLEQAMQSEAVLQARHMGFTDEIIRQVQMQAIIYTGSFHHDSNRLTKALLNRTSEPDSVPQPSQPGLVNRITRLPGQTTRIRSSSIGSTNITGTVNGVNIEDLPSEVLSPSNSSGYNSSYCSSGSNVEFQNGTMLINGGTMEQIMGGAFSHPFFSSGSHSSTSSINISGANIGSLNTPSHHPSLQHTTPAPQFTPSTSAPAQSTNVAPTPEPTTTSSTRDSEPSTSNPTNANAENEPSSSTATGFTEQRCEYSKQQEGPARVDNITRQHSDIVRPPFSRRVLRQVVPSPTPLPYPNPVPPVTTQAPSTSSHTRSRIEDPQQMLEQRDQLLEQAMQSEAVLQARHMGFSDERIRQVQMQAIINTGSFHHDSNRLTQALLNRTGEPDSVPRPSPPGLVNRIIRLPGQTIRIRSSRIGSTNMTGTVNGVNIEDLPSEELPPSQNSGASGSNVTFQNGTMLINGRTMEDIMGEAFSHPFFSSGSHSSTSSINKSGANIGSLNTPSHKSSQHTTPAPQCTPSTDTSAPAHGAPGIVGNLSYGRGRRLGRRSTNVPTPAPAQSTNVAPTPEPTTTSSTRDSEPSISNPINANEENEPSTSTATGSTEQRLDAMVKERRCKICLTAEADILFQPCGHICACAGCSDRLQQCPVCRRRIYRYTRVYHA